MEELIMQVDPITENLVKNHHFFLSEYQRYTLSGEKAFTRPERLNIVWVVCKDLPVAHDGVFAKLQLDTTLNVVEDHFSNIIWSPSMTIPEGRMYPAGEDWRREDGFINAATYKNRGHISHFGINGAILVQKIDNKTRNQITVFSKIGADDRNVGDDHETQLSRIS